MLAPQCQIGVIPMKLLLVLSLLPFCALPAADGALVGGDDGVSYPPHRSDQETHSAKATLDAVGVCDRDLTTADITRLAKPTPIRKDAP